MLRPFIKDVLAVHELSQCIKQLLREAFPFVAVCGEISNLKQANGVTYFTLKDEYSQVPVVCFQSDVAHFSISLQAGKTVIVEGRIDVYAKTGRYQIIGKKIRAVGSGYWQQRLEQLKQKLAAEGLFSAERKKPLPSLPKHIALLTSREGAALKDFLSILNRKQWRGHVSLFPSLVQGEKAAQSLIRAFKQAEKLPSIDIIVLIRGGGSIEDLWCFNDEMLVRTLAKSKKATLTGIGHEIDYSLCDFVADCRVETPSAAAEKIANTYLTYVQQVNSLSNRLTAYTQIYLNRSKQQVRICNHRLSSTVPKQKIQTLHHHLQCVQNKLTQLYCQKLNHSKHLFTICSTQFACVPLRRRVQDTRKYCLLLSQKLHKSFEIRIHNARQFVHTLGIRLSNVSLESQLRKGFIIPLDQQTQQPKDLTQLALESLIPIAHKSGKYVVQIKSTLV